LKLTSLIFKKSETFKKKNDIYFKAVEEEDRKTQKELYKAHEASSGSLDKHLTGALAKIHGAGIILVTSAGSTRRKENGDNDDNSSIILRIMAGFAKYSSGCCNLMISYGKIITMDTKPFI
jgi:hypothetical protein